MTFIVNNVSVKTKEGREIIKDLSFVLNNDDKLAIIGEEGNGKSTLLKFFYDKNLIEQYCYYEGSTNLNKIKIGYIPQILDSEILNLGVVDFLTDNYSNQELNYDIYNEFFKIENLFKQYNLSLLMLDENRLISTLSGGERIKIQMIKLILKSYDLYLFDEVTNDIDHQTLELIKSFIINVSSPVIIASHDESFISEISNCILHLEQLKRKHQMVYTFLKVGYQDYLSIRSSKIKKQNSEAYQTRKELGRKQEILRKQHEKVENALNNAVRDPTQGRLLAKKMRNIKSQEKKLNNSNLVDFYVPEEEINIFFDSKKRENPNRVIFSINDFCLKIENKVLCQSLDLMIKGNSRIGISGENGAGKTTLIKEIIRKLNEKRIDFDYMSQDYFQILNEELSPLDYLQTLYGYEKETKDKIMSYLGALNFVEFEMLNKIKYLSGGEKAKIFFIQLVLNNKDLIILDEPTRNLSPLSTLAITKFFNQYNGSLLIVSHDKLFIENVCSEIYILSKDGLKKIR